MLKIETVEETVYLEVNALEGYARKEYVDDAIDGINSSISNVESDVSTINSELENKTNKSDLEGLATERYVDEKIDNIPEVDLTPYATKEELEDKADISYVDDKISDIKIPSIEGLATEEYVDSKVGSIDLSEYATEEYVDSEIGKIYIPSLDGYATEGYVDNKVSSIDLSGYALTSDLSSAIESINSDLDLKADKTELEGLATEDYVDKKIDEKEVGITEPELISKSVGSGKWMREGAYGIGVTNAPFLANDSNYGNVENGVYSIRGGFIDKPSYGTTGSTAIRAGWNENYYAVMHFSTGNGRISAKLMSNDNTQGWQEFYTDMNTYPDSNGVLHNSRNPIDTLNTSDMADTVVDNDLLTVTSGAVYRAITKLQNKIDELEGQVNELKALYEQ